MTDITSHRKNAPLSMWGWWVVAGMVGFGVGGSLGVILGTPGYIIENGFMSILFGGALSAAFQWLLLRRRIVPSGWWMPSCAGGAIVFGILVFGGLAVDAGGTWITDVTWILGASLFMPVSAWLQWRLVLKRHLAGGAIWWVLANLVGFFGGGFGSWPVSAIFGLNGKEGGLDALVVWSAFGAVYGAVTGAILLWLLLRRRRAEAPTELEVSP